MSNYETKVRTRTVTYEETTHHVVADSIARAEALALECAGVGVSIVTAIVLLADDAPAEYVPYSTRGTNEVAEATSDCDTECECDESTEAEEATTEYVPYSTFGAGATTAPAISIDDDTDDDWDEDPEDEAQQGISNLTDEERSVGQVQFPTAEDDAEDQGEYVTYSQRFGGVSGFVPCAELVNLTVTPEPGVIPNGNGGYAPYSQLHVTTED